MRVLADTNVVIKWAFGEKLPNNIFRLLGKQTTEVWVSVVSLWEIALKDKVRKLELPFFVVREVLVSMGANILQLSTDHIERLCDLTIYQYDPYDCMLIAQALHENLTMISSDTRFEQYKGLRVIWG